MDLHFFPTNFVQDCSIYMSGGGDVYARQVLGWGGFGVWSVGAMLVYR